MATAPEPIRIGNQHPFTVPPERRDPAPGCAGTNIAIARLGGSHIRAGSGQRPHPLP
jgi:hypothetical protein